LKCVFAARILLSLSSLSELPHLIAIIKWDCEFAYLGVDAIFFSILPFSSPLSLMAAAERLAALLTNLWGQARPAQIAVLPVPRENAGLKVSLPALLHPEARLEEAQSREGSVNSLVFTPA